MCACVCARALPAAFAKQASMTKFTDFALETWQKGELMDDTQSYIQEYRRRSTFWGMRVSTNKLFARLQFNTDKEVWCLRLGKNYRLDSSDRKIELTEILRIESAKRPWSHEAAKKAKLKSEDMLDLHLSVAGGDEDDHRPVGQLSPARRCSHAPSQPVNHDPCRLSRPQAGDERNSPLSVGVS